MICNNFLYTRFCRLHGWRARSKNNVNFIRNANTEPNHILYQGALLLFTYYTLCGVVQFDMPTEIEYRRRE